MCKNSQESISICKYCEKEEAIENSHIIPSFIYKWIKDTSPTKALRATNNPNKRKQDGYKSALLCQKCEEIFSQYENDFKKNIFNKIANYRSDYPELIKITKKSLNCIYSIAWRTLADAYYFEKDHKYTEEEFSYFPYLWNEIKELIHSGKSDRVKTHFIPCTEKTLQMLGLSVGKYIYFFERSAGVEPRAWDDLARFNIHIKIPFGIFIVELISNENDTWCGTKIDGEDELNIDSINCFPEFLRFEIEYFNNDFLKSIRKINPKQSKIIEQDINNYKGDCGSFKSQRKSNFPFE